MFLSFYNVWLNWPVTDFELHGIIHSKQVSTSMMDLCFDSLGVSKEKKDAKDVKGNRGMVGYSSFSYIFYKYRHISVSMCKIYLRFAWCVTWKEETRGWWIFIWWWGTFKCLYRVTLSLGLLNVTFADILYICIGAFAVFMLQKTQEDGRGQVWGLEVHSR